MHCEEAPHAARVSAAQAMLARGLGMPTQAVSLELGITIRAIERRIVDPIVVIEAEPVLNALASPLVAIVEQDEGESQTE